MARSAIYATKTDPEPRDTYARPPTVNLDAQHDSVHPHFMPVGSTDRRV